METKSFGPRSRANARKLIEAAIDLGYDVMVVRTTVGGYIAPADVVDLGSGVAGIEEGVTYPAPEESAPEVPSPIETPKGNAPRAVWEEFAAEHGIDGEGMEYAELKRVATEAAQEGKEG